MNRTDLHEQAHVSTNAIATMGKGGDVSTKVLDKICKTLDCQIHDIVDYVPDDDDVQEALLLPVESLYMMRHRLLMQPVLPRMNTMIMRKETMRLYSIELLSLIRI